MKKIAVIANCGKPGADKILKCLSLKAAELGLELVADTDTRRLCPLGSCDDDDPLYQNVDAVMALGGDGTMLRVVRELKGRDTPVIGFNIGSLGFMTSVAEADFDGALECLAKDDFVISERTMIDCEVHREGKPLHRYRALNDIVLERGPSSRIVTLTASVDDKEVTSYVCDGIIVSTPTGSTGHSLAAGGPILTPETRAFVISLICPHTLSSRPIVLPDSSKVSVSATESDGDLLLTIDGQLNRPLFQDDRIDISRAENGVKFILLPHHNYFRVLRQKLHWRGSNVSL